MLSKKDYQDALFVLDACNLSGVVHSFSRVISKVWEEAHELGKGTDYVNTHPLCVLYAEKIYELTRARVQFDEAYGHCRKMAEEDVANV